MCKDEDTGKRPVHRPRVWRERERRLEKEDTSRNWHKKKPNQISAPLIIDPVAGSMASEMREVCRKF